MKKITLLTFITLLVCTSCVTKKKYMIAETGRIAAIASGDSLYGLLSDCRNKGTQMSAQIKNLMQDTTRMGNRHSGSLWIDDAGAISAPVF